MQAIPKTFVQIHQIAGSPPSETEKRWGDVNEETAKELLEFLVKENILDEQQLTKLEQISQEFLKKEIQTSILVALAPVLKKGQVDTVSQKYVEILAQKVNLAYQRLFNSASLEERQVIGSFLKIHGNRQ